MKGEKVNTEEIFERSEEIVSDKTEEPKTLEEFVELLFENPSYASKSSQYLLDAIEYFGTREVIEQGETKERFVFFDDPINNGEHAILGNTDELNRFVERLRQLANSETSSDDKIIWIEGPTATGKSEFRKCITNGLNAYSKTEEGKRYTLEWNTKKNTSERRGTAHGDVVNEVKEKDWSESQVQVNPVSVFPEEVRKEIEKELDKSIPVRTGLDPFSRESYRILKRRYEEESGNEEIFSKITSPENLRVVRYVIEEGKGIGVLQSEDEGKAKQRLVGTWMPQLFGKLSSVGRKNPQAFSYDGLLSQGNSNVSFIEEASHHAELLHKFLNIPEDGYVKLNQRIQFDIDTVFIILSNPDFSAQIEQHSDKPVDPLKALRRRLDKFEFTYLLNKTLEAALLKREIGIWDNRIENASETLKEPVELPNTRLSRHVIETVSLAAVVSRLDSGKQGLSYIEKAELFETGTIEHNGEEKDISDFSFEENKEGRDGIPVTTTRDVILSLDDSEKDVIVPQEALEVLINELDINALFNEGDVKKYSERIVEVKEYVLQEQEKDVLNAIFRERSVSKEQLDNYVDSVKEWDGNGVEEEDYEPLRLKVFETKYLGFDDSDYNGSKPGNDVKEFRRKIIKELSDRIWEEKNENFEVDDINYKKINIFEERIGQYSWKDVFKEYEDFDPSQWDDTREGTQTHEVKNIAIENMQEMFGYSKKGARKTARFVMSEVKKNEH